MFGILKKWIIILQLILLSSTWAQEWIVFTIPDHNLVEAERNNLSSDIHIDIENNEYYLTHIDGVPISEYEDYEQVLDYHDLPIFIKIVSNYYMSFSSSGKRLSCKDFHLKGKEDDVYTFWTGDIQNQFSHGRESIYYMISSSRIIIDFSDLIEKEIEGSMWLDETLYEYTLEYAAYPKDQ